MRKWLAVLLMSSLLVSLVACGNQEESKTSDSVVEQSTNETETATGTEPVADEKPYAGMHFKIWGPDLAYADKTFEKPDGNWWMYYAIEEWCAMNDCTWEYEIGNSEINVLQSKLVAEEAIDLYYYNGQFPMIAKLGIAQPIDDYLPAIEEALVGVDISGHTYEDGGKTYGLMSPYEGVLMCQYDRTLFEDYGVKTPKEYFMEDNWTFETYEKCLKEIAKDTDGDGKFDVLGGCIGRSVMLAAPPTKVNADGSISPNVDTERNRDLFNILYNAVAVEKTVDPTDFVGSITTDPSGQYHAMALTFRTWNRPEQVVTTSKDGHVLETVPFPKWKADDPEEFQNGPSWGYMIPRTAQNVEASISLMTHILKFHAEVNSVFSDGMVDFEWDGIEGYTPEVQNFEKVLHEYAAAQIATVKNMPEYDTEYMTKMMNYMLNAPKKKSLSLPGVKSNFNSGSLNALWWEPTATSIPKVTEIIKGECDKYNVNYVH